MMFNTLASRLIGSLLAVLVISQAVSVAVFANRQEDREASERERQFLRQAAVAIGVLEGLPFEARRDALQPFNTGQSRFSLDFVSAITSTNQATGDDLSAFETANIALGDILVQRFDDPRTLWDRFIDVRMFPPDRPPPPPRLNGDGQRPPPPRLGPGGQRLNGPPPNGPPPNGPPGRRPPLDEPKQIVISVPLSDGQWINGRMLWPDKPPPWLMPLLAQVVLSALGFTLVVVFLVRHNTKSLKQLAATADRIGRGEEFEDLPEVGPNEIKRTLMAFNSMASRIKRMVQGRTRMLAAISHDLRTPITSLRIRAELVPETENRERMLATLDEMQSLAEATLTLARQDAVVEDTSIVDVAALVESVCDDLADVGQPVTFAPATRIPYPCRANGLKRAVRNLVENAVKYGTRADVSLTHDAKGIVIHVDDAGPGIPAHKMKRIFQPFVRLEESRSKDTGGFGLGLSIARSIVHGHGGEITLENRSGGGLRATITLPPAAA